MAIERGSNLLTVALAVLGMGICLVLGAVAVAARFFGVPVGLPTNETGATLLVLAPLLWLCARHAEQPRTAFLTICLEVAAVALVVATYTNCQTAPTVLAFLVSTVGLVVRLGSLI